MSTLDDALNRNVADPVVAWVEATQAFIIRHGRALSMAERTVAADVGVKAIDRLRILQCAEIPIPLPAVVKSLAERVNLREAGLQGFAFGYGVWIRSGLTVDLEIFAHEFRHVHQLERFNGVAEFVCAYLSDVEVQGYRESNFEVDARRAARDIRDLHCRRQ